MYAFFAVALGGILGCSARYALGLWLVERYPKYFFLSTLLVNLLGCLAIGYLYALFLARPEWPVVVRTGLMVGLLGGFTTFSSFSLDTLRLVEQGQLLIALGYLTLTVGGGLLTTALGIQLARY